MPATLRDLRAFFFWLAHQPGFKSHIAYADADYFNLSDKDVAVARARREKRVPTLDQVRARPRGHARRTALERRDRALVAFAMLTGARVGALASFRLGHVDMAEASSSRTRARCGPSPRRPSAPTSCRSDDERAGDRRRLGGGADAGSPLGAGRPAVPGHVMGAGRRGRLRARRASRGAAGARPSRSRHLPRAFALAGLPYFNPHPSATCWCATPWRSTLRPKR